MLLIPVTFRRRTSSRGTTRVLLAPTDPIQPHFGYLPQDPQGMIEVCAVLAPRCLCGCGCLQVPRRLQWGIASMLGDA